MTDFDDAPAARRTPYRRNRTHHVVEHGGPPTMRLNEFDEVDPWSEHPGSAAVDPRLARVGAVAAAALLMIPVALAVRDDGGGELRSTTASVTSTLPAAPTAPVVVPITAAVIAPAAAVVVDAASDEADVQADVVEVPEPPACAGTYTVVFNDFWNRFPASSGASVEEWLSANGATADTPLYVGDELCIPEGATAPAPAPTTTAPPATTAAAPQTAAPPPPTAPPAPPPMPALVVTTPAPTTPPTTAPGPTLSPAEVEALIREIWPDDLEERALSIAKRESGLRPWVNNWCCYGVFAIYFEMGKSWLADLGVTSAAQLYDARTNIAAAYHLYTRSGWGPWSQTDPG